MNESGDQRLQGKVAIVTGAGRGIGEAIAHRFAQAGARVIVNARTESSLVSVARDIEQTGGIAHAVAADMGTQAGVETLISATREVFGGIDILVHNAGIFPYRPLEKMEDAEWNEVINVNLTGAYRLTRACIPAMKERWAGRVLFTSSVQGNYVAVPGCSHYAASKAGLSGLIRAAALELASSQITVNGVEPGLVKTAGVEQALPEHKREMMAQYVPLKRWGQPMEIAHAMLFLASEEAAYITGQTIVVDGGALLPQNGAFMVT